MKANLARPVPLGRREVLRRCLHLALPLVGVLGAAWLLTTLNSVSPVRAGGPADYAVIDTYPNPAPAADEQFGSSLAWMTATNEFLVGAPGDRLGGSTPLGAAYIINLSGTVQHVLQAPDAGSGDLFGLSLAVAVTNVVVGAPHYDRGIGSSNLGAAYLFDGDGGSVIYTFTHGTTTSNDQFGYAVAIISDTLVVGVPQYDNPLFDSGRVYLCSLITGLCPDFIGSPTVGTSANFGRALAVSGGYIAVGAPGDAGHGSVFVYAYDGITATLAYTIAESAISSSDEFGRALAVLGDRLLIGAPTDNFGADNAGLAYLYELDGTQVYTFTNPQPDDNDRFGSSLSTDGTLIAIGATNNDTGALDSGAVYLYDALTWEYIATVRAPSPTASAQFGYALAPAPGGEFLAGAFDTLGAAGAGAVHRIGIQTEWLLHLPLIMK